MDNKILARDIHGPMHACRTAIGALVSFRLLESNLPDLESDPHFLTQLSGATHDIARQDESVDYWTTQSASWTKSYGIIKGALSNAEVNNMYHSISEKDPEGGVFSTNDQRAVHDGDVLEILRCLVSLKDFRKDELQFYKKYQNDPENNNTMDQLIEEWFILVKTTEKEELKLYFEKSVENHYAELMRLIDYLSRKGLFALLEVILRPELSVFSNRSLSKEIIKIIDL